MEYKPHPMHLFWFLFSAAALSTPLPCHLQVAEEARRFTQALERLEWAQADFDARVQQALAVSVGDAVSTAGLVDDLTLSDELGGSYAVFQRQYRAAFDQAASLRFPARLKATEKNILVVTHQESHLGAATLDKIRAWKKSRRPHLILAHPEHPLDDPRLVAQGPVVRFSSEGEVFGTAVQRATVVGGHLQSCLAGTVVSLITTSLDAGLTGVELTLPADLIYTDTLARAPLSSRATRVAVDEEVRAFVEELSHRKALKGFQIELHAPPAAERFGHRIRLVRGDGRWAEIRLTLDQK